MKQKPKVIFMGSSDFAVPALKVANKLCDVELVVVQPDKKRGRGNKVTFLPVKEEALELGLNIYQPQDVSSKESEEFLRSFDPDLFIVASYGQILKENILDIPELGSLNIHGSILPKYRGAAPIQRTLLNNETITGNTIMKMERGMDTGPMLAHSEFKIPDSMTSDELFNVLSVDGARLLDHILEDYIDGRIIEVEQNHKKATYAPKIEKKEAHINWDQPALLVLKQINAMDSNPGAYANLNNQKVKLFKPDLHFDNTEAQPGTVLAASQEDKLVVKCKDGAVKITEIQKPGKKRIGIEDYLRGNKIEIGTILN